MVCGQCPPYWLDLLYDKPVRNDNSKDYNPGLRPDRFTVAYNFNNGKIAGFQEFKNPRPR
jgi:hypothetical protein